MGVYTDSLGVRGGARASGPRPHIRLLVGAAGLTLLAVASVAAGSGQTLWPGAAGQFRLSAPSTTLISTSTVNPWPTFHGNPQLSGVSPDGTVSSGNASGLGLQWMTPTGAPVDSSPVTGVDAATGALLAYVGNTAGDLEAIDVGNGSIVWSDSFGVPIYATPTVYGQDLWVGTFVAGVMYKLNASTGAIECRIPLGTGTDLSSPTIATPSGGVPTVYFGVEDNGSVSGPIMAVNETTCAVDWSVTPYAQESGSWNPTSYAVDGTGTAIVLAGSANPNSTAYALNATTGATVWSNRNLHPADDDVGAGLTVSSPSATAPDGSVYYPGEDGILYAINLTTGKTEWTFNFRSATTPSPYKGGRSAAALAGSTLVFGTGTGVMAVSTSGQELWDSAHTIGPETEIVSSPLITGPAGQQVVIYGDMNGAVKVLSLATGALLYSFQTHGYILASPADCNGQILITSSDGFIYSLGLGGSNGGASPTTTVTTPANGATLPNPNSGTASGSEVTLSGLATSPDPAPAVIVAVQENGPTGEYWNSSTATWQPGLAWNQASVTDTSSTTATWAISVPAARAGATWEIWARTRDADGEVDPTGATSYLTISPVTSGPRIYLSSTMVPPGQRVEVSGAGFQAGELVYLSLEGNAPEAVATASSTGTFPKTPLLIPTKFPYGLGAVSAVGGTSGLATTAPLYVTSSWPELGASPTRTGNLPNDYVFNQEEVPDKIYRMVASVVYDTGAAIESSPAVFDRVAYVGNNAGDVAAVSTDSGALLWQATTGAAVVSSPALDPPSHLVIVGSEDGNIYGLSMLNGSVLWKYATGGPVISSPALADGVVYIGSGDGFLYALQANSGSLLWRADLGSAVNSSPAVDIGHQRLVVGDSAGTVEALSIGGSGAGTVLWGYQTSGAVQGMPVIDAGTVYFGSADGLEYAVSESTGALDWSTNLGGTPSMTAALNEQSLYVGSGGDYLYSLSTSNGAVQWKYPTSAAVTGVVATVGMLFAEASDGTMYGFRSRGENVWLAAAGTSLFGTPALSDNAVVVGAGDSGLYIYTPFGLPMT